MEVNPKSFFLLPSEGAVKFPNFTPSAPHHFPTLSFLWERPCLRLMQGAPEGGMESSPSARLTTDSWKLTLDKGRGAWWLEGPRLFFFYREDSLSLGFGSFTMMCQGEIFFVFILCGLPDASTVCLDFCPFWKNFSHYLFLYSFSPLLWNPNCVHVQPFGIVPHVSYTLLYIF